MKRKKAGSWRGGLSAVSFVMGVFIISAGQPASSFSVLHELCWRWDEDIR
jgi:hypothetical protein